MIVLDEQLLGHTIEITLARWYPGRVCFINDLRPDSVIKDESIATLLQRAPQCTFVTINETDFWRQVAVTNAFCIVCAAVPTKRKAEVAVLVRRLLRHPQFRTKKQRMGRVVRITAEGAFYYTADDATVRPVENW